LKFFKIADVVRYYETIVQRKLSWQLERHSVAVERKLSFWRIPDFSISSREFGF